MAKDKKHHFVPICYLNHFKQNGHLHYYSKKGKMKISAQLLIFARKHTSILLHRKVGGKHLR